MTVRFKIIEPTVWISNNAAQGACCIFSLLSIVPINVYVKDFLLTRMIALIRRLMDSSEEIREIRHVQRSLTRRILSDQAINLDPKRFDFIR